MNVRMCFDCFRTTTNFKSNEIRSFPTKKHIAVFCMKIRGEGRKGEGRREGEWGKTYSTFLSKQ